MFWNAEHFFHANLFEFYSRSTSRFTPPGWSFTLYSPYSVLLFFCSLSLSSTSRLAVFFFLCIYVLCERHTYTPRQSHFGVNCLCILSHYRILCKLYDDKHFVCFSFTLLLFGKLLFWLNQGKVYTFLILCLLLYTCRSVRCSIFALPGHATLFPFLFKFRSIFFCSSIFVKQNT